MSQEGQIEQIDVKALQEELNNLKTSYVDLQNRYSQLEKQHNSYKLDIEFKKDISGVTRSLKDEELEVLKSLKENGNEQAYNMLLDSFRATPMSTGGLGNFARNFSSMQKETDNTENQVDDFTQAIKDMKGVQ